jgi:hypothetical protein
VEILRNIDVEIAALCMAGLVLLRLAYELYRIYSQSEEAPPRLIQLDGTLDPVTGPVSPIVADTPGVGCDDGA